MNDRDGSRRDLNPLSVGNPDDGAGSDGRIPLGLAARDRLDAVVGAGGHLSRISWR